MSKFNWHVINSEYINLCGARFEVLTAVLIYTEVIFFDITPYLQYNDVWEKRTSL